MSASWCIYPLPKYSGMALYFLIQLAIIIANVMSSVTIRNLIKQRNSVQFSLMASITLFTIKTLFFVAVGIQQLVRGEPGENLGLATRQITFVLDIALTCIYFGFLFKMKLVQIQMNENNLPPV